MAGTACHLVGLPDPHAEPVTYTVMVEAGPLILTDSATGMPLHGVLFCRVHVDQPTHAGDSVFDASARDHMGIQSVVGVSSFQAPPDAKIYACTEFVEDTTHDTFYFDPSRGTWGTNQNGPCGLAGVVLGAVFYAVDCYVLPPCTANPTIVKGA